MRRYLPFLIIAAVGLLTVGAAATFYWSKMKPAPATAAAAAPKPTPGASANATAAATIEKEDESVHARGPRNAPVTMEVYGDFQCPSCALASGAIHDLQKEFEPRVRVIFHHFPLAMHQHAVTAAMAAEAAGLQGHFWEMHDALYKFQPAWSRATDPSAFFAAYAESIGLDAGQFAVDARSPEVKARVMTEGDGGVARGVKNTPTIFINGSEVRNGFRPEVLKQAIEAALAEKE